MRVDQAGKQDRFAVVDDLRARKVRSKLIEPSDLREIRPPDRHRAVFQRQGAGGQDEAGAVEDRG